MINRLAIALVVLQVCAGRLVAAETLQPKMLRQPAEAAAPWAEEKDVRDPAVKWFERFLAFPYTNAVPTGPAIQLIRYPFSFTYNHQPSDTLLPAWPIVAGSTNSGDGVTASWRAWTDTATGLCVRWESRSHQGFPDCDWVLHVENTGSRDTPIIEDIQALDLTLAAPLGLEAVITDAGWFEGGWPAGAGNWTPRHDAYPLGMAPVAAAAAARGMVYGLWFEPERVVAGTEFHRLHPDWVLTDGRPGQTTLLANFGLREVQDHFFAIVQGFMALPGFRFYRQDFNLDPLDYWRHHDAPDRQGITEMRYLEGLYAYWDRLAAAWPDSLREECVSGGRRIDLETLSRLPLHQKSDYWFDNEVDQASLWGLSQYLPNNLITVPLTRLDDYSFRSTLAASLIPAWIADAPGFDRELARQMLDRYRAIRHLLVGAWYPLLPYTRNPRDWMAVQFHRPDLGEGMILVFRHAESPYRTVEIALHGLNPERHYTLSFDSSGEKRRVRGADLRSSLQLSLASRPSSELITYREERERR